MSEHNEFPKEFFDWCENKSGWQLVLEKLDKDNYLVMAGQLEKSRELEKKKLKSKGETAFDENSLDSDFYMTLGFCGTAEEIKPIAKILLNEFKDGFCKLFNTLENTIRRSEDAARYEINTEKFNRVFIELSVSSLSFSNVPKKSFLGNFIRRFKAYPDIHLSVENATTNNETLTIRKNNIDDCIDLLSNIEDFSDHILLLVAYNYFSISDRVNIHIDYEYLWYFGDKV